MKLSSRFLLDGLFVIAAAFLTVAAVAWSAGTAGWTAFGVMAGVVLVAGASAALGTRASRRAAHGLIALVALWSAFAALIFTGPALVWLAFGGAVATGVLALADLALHEATTERIVHSLEIAPVVAEPASDSRVAA